MQIVRDPSLANTVENAEIRSLIQKLYSEICDGAPFEYDRHGYMVVVEPGDTVQSLEEATGCSILKDPTNDARLGDPSFVPAFEFIDEHSSCYRLDLTINDDGFGVAIIVPKAEGINSELLQLCARYAEPAPEEVTA